MHESNCFITLTFNDEHLPRNGSLDVRYFQLFMKRLRKKFGAGIRFYHCGEYGSHFGRPHFHACLFNFDFQDKYLWKITNNVPLFRSKDLEDLWTDPHTGESYGYSSVGNVTFESAAYVARYIMKKITGDMAEDHYSIVDPDTGEILMLKPEYTTMSRRPGIGATWFEKYASDVYPGDFVVLNGKKMRPPKFYDGLYELAYPEDMADLRKNRTLQAEKHFDNNTPERLSVRERITLDRIRRLPRNHDEEF